MQTLYSHNGVFISWLVNGFGFTMSKPRTSGFFLVQDSLTTTVAVSIFDAPAVSSQVWPYVSVPQNTLKDHLATEHVSLVQISHVSVQVPT